MSSLHHSTARLPNRLWKYRTRMGFTQRQVATILGYHTSCDISHYEHGRKVPSLVTALKLEIVYRVPVAFLFPELYGELKCRLRFREEGVRAGHSLESRSRHRRRRPPGRRNCRRSVPARQGGRHRSHP